MGGDSDDSDGQGQGGGLGGDMSTLPGNPKKEGRKEGRQEAHTQNT